MRLIQFSRIVLCVASLFPCAGIHAGLFSFLCGGHYLSVGPEIEYVRRTRPTGSRMNGDLYGGYLSYGRIKRNSLYYGAETYWVTGQISGTIPNTADPTLRAFIKADETDFDIEGRIGITLQSSPPRCWTLVPYVGYGYFRGITHFRPTGSSQTSGIEPVELINVRFSDNFQHYSAGFISNVWLSCNWAIGLNFEWKGMIDGKEKIDDPKADSTIYLLMGDKATWEVYLPITYNTTLCCKNIWVSIIPFYRLREYGGREDFPFDFVATKFQIYGGRAALTFLF